MLVGKIGSLVDRQSATMQVGLNRFIFVIADYFGIVLASLQNHFCEHRSMV